MKKLNWQIDFLKLVADRKNTQFEWGVNDCVMFAADSVVIMSNTDPVPLSRGSYDSERSAKKHLIQTYGNLEELWDKALERIENINFVQNGDVVLFNGELGATSGIYWNGGVFATALEGVRFFDELHSKLTAAWRV